MKRTFSLLLLTIIVLLGIIACSDDNGTNPADDYQNLVIPDDFNWTNLDFVKLNISIATKTTNSNLVIVRHNDKVLARKFLQDGSLEMTINSINSYNSLTVQVPAYSYSQEISTNIKEHTLVVPVPTDEKYGSQANIDPYFSDAILDDDSEFVTINKIDSHMIQGFINNNNIFIPTEVPQANTGWYKYKFNETGNGEIEQVSDGLNKYLLLGPDWVIMQTIDVEGFDYFNELLEGAITEETVNKDQCPYGSYLTNTYIFLDEDMNYQSFFPWTPWSYTDTERFFSDRTNNTLSNAKYMVIVGQYNGYQGNVRLNNWLITMFETNQNESDSDGDGISNSEDLEPGNPNVAGEINIPGGFIMFEDLWPNQGDYDFNDLYVYITDSQIKINGQNKLVYQDLYLKVMKSGANLNNGFALRYLNAEQNGATTSLNTIDADNLIHSVVAYSLPNDLTNGTSNGDWSTMTYIDKFSPNTAILINDVKAINLNQGDDMSIRIYFNPETEHPENPIPDYFLYQSHNRANEIHLAGYPPTEYANTELFGTGDDASLLYPDNWYKTENNFPWALYFSIDKWVPAVKENVSIFQAYPEFSGWVTSGGSQNQDWINRYVPALTENPWSD